MSDQNRLHMLKNRNEVQDVLVFAENALMMTSDDDSRLHDGAQHHPNSHQTLVHPLSPTGSMICQAPTSNVSDSEQNFAQTSAPETRYHSFIAPYSSKLANGHKSAKKKRRRGKGRGNPKEDALANQTKQSNIQRRGRAVEKKMTAMILRCGKEIDHGVGEYCSIRDLPRNLTAADLVPIRLKGMFGKVPLIIIEEIVAQHSHEAPLDIIARIRATSDGVAYIAPVNVTEKIGHRKSKKKISAQDTSRRTGISREAVTKKQTGMTLEERRRSVFPLNQHPLMTSADLEELLYQKEENPNAMIINALAEGNSFVPDVERLNPNRLKDIFTKLSLQFIEQTVVLYSNEDPVKIMMRLRAANEALRRVLNDKKYVLRTKAPGTETNSSQMVIRKEKPEQAPEKIGNTVGTSTYPNDGMTFLHQPDMVVASLSLQALAIVDAEMT